MIENATQYYMKDAIRNIEIKIFKAEIWLSSGKQVYFFTNRLELGHTKEKGSASVYEKLQSVRNIVNAQNWEQCEKEFKKNTDGNKFVDGI